MIGVVTLWLSVWDGVCCGDGGLELVLVGSAGGNNRPLLPQANTLTVVPDCPDCRPLNLSDVHKYSNSKMGNTQITSLKFDSMAIIVDFKHMTGIKSTVHASGGLPTK